MKANSLTVGQAIRKINNVKIKPVYFLYGKDIFLQDFFINELCKMKLSLKKNIFHFGIDTEASFFDELSNVSLFNDEKIIIIKNLKKMSKLGRDNLLIYLKDPNPHHFLIIVKNNFEKNKFINEIKANTDTIDTGVPFDSKMKEWVKYFLKRKKISIDESYLNDYIYAYGDNITNVVHEIEKEDLRLYGKDHALAKHSINRQYYPWHLQDSIGRKNNSLSQAILDSLFSHGTSVNLVIYFLFHLYKNLFDKKFFKSNQGINFGINKIISSRISIYATKYSNNEIENIIIALRDIDWYSKNTTLNIRNILHCLLANICRGYYE